MKQTHSVLRFQDEKQQRLLRSILQSCYFLFLCTDLEPCTLVGILSMRFASQSLMKYPSARKIALCFAEQFQIQNLLMYLNYFFSTCLLFALIVQK